MATGSLAEAVAAAVVEAILALVVAAAAVATLLSAGVAIERTLATAELARFELVVLDACGRVLAGSDAPVPAATAGRFEIGFLDGEPERRVAVFDRGAGLRVEVAGVGHRFASLRLERVEVGRSPVPHLSLTVRAAGSRTHEIRAPFGLIPPP